MSEGSVFNGPIRACAIALGLCVALLAPDAARAGCNLIPFATREVPSSGEVTTGSGGGAVGPVVNGFVDRRIAGPGDTVTVRADRGCTPSNAGFALPGAANPNVVRLLFRSPSGPVTEVVIDPSGDPDLVRPLICGALRCRAVQFEIPDTSSFVSGGLTGPVEIQVERVVGGSPEVVARIYELFQSTRSCNAAFWAPDPVFGTFTVVPNANALVEGDTLANPALLGAVDGNGNLLLPIDFSAVLQSQPGASDATLLRVESGNADILLALGAGSSDTDDLRAFNPFGRPIPPLFRLVKEPAPAPAAFVGTTDVVRSVLQVAPLSPAFEYASRMRQNGSAAAVGAVELLGADVSVQSVTPLSGLRTSLEVVAASADESTLGVDRNFDGDQGDLVAEITNVTTGVDTNTAIALGEVASAPDRPVLVTDGPTVAVSQSEAASGFLPVNADGDFFDQILRVFSVQGGGLPATEVTGAPFQTLDAAAVVNGAPMAISGGRVFARESEAASSPRVTDRASEAAGGGNPTSTSQQAVLSADGRFVAFASSATNLIVGDTNARQDVFLTELESGIIERVSVGPGGVEGNNNSDAPAISADGRFVSFRSSATNLVAGDTNGQADVFLHDRDLGVTTRVSVGTGGVQGNNRSDNSALSADGRFVAFDTRADNFDGLNNNGSNQDVFVHDTLSNTTGRVSLGFDGLGPDAPSGSPAISADGRFVVFLTGADNMVPGVTSGINIFLWDREAPSPPLEVVSLDSNGLPGTISSSRPVISADGNVVGWRAQGSLVPEDTNGSSADAYVRDRSRGRTEIVSLGLGGVSGNAQTLNNSRPAISADGRFVAFDSLATNLVPLDTNLEQDCFVHDRLTGVTERVSVSSAGVQGNRACGVVSLSGDGRKVSFETGSDNFVAGDTATIDIFVRSVTAVPLNGDTDADDVVLTVLEASTGTLLNAAAGERLPASQVSVGGGRALVLVPEQSVGGALNDAPRLVGANADLADETDLVVQLYDPSLPVIDRVQNLGVASSQGLISLSDTVACVGVNESGQADSLLNGDGDALDDALATARIDTITGGGDLTNAAVSVASLQAAGDACVFLRPESEDGDLNGDGDALDLVLNVLEVPAVGSPVLRNLGWAAEDFIVSDDGNIVAFRTPEASEFRASTTGAPPGCLATGTDGECDLNGDGDTADLVLQIVSLQGLAIATPDDRPMITANSFREAIACVFDACEAFELYRAEEVSPGVARVSFLGTEPGQAVGLGCLPQSPFGGCDLDGNGVGTNTVVHIATSENGVITSIQTLPVDTGAKVGFFPTPVVGQTVVTTQKTECEAAQYACSELKDPALVFAATLPYEPGSCLQQLDTDPADLSNALDCETRLSWIVGDGDRTPDLAGDPRPDPDGVLDFATNGVDDLCQESPDAGQVDADGDGLGDTAGAACDPDPGSPLPSAASCDLDDSGDIDRLDVDLIVESAPEEAVGFPALGWDRRDRNADGYITGFDSVLCEQECDLTNCQRPGGACGLLGAEVLLPLGLLALGRRRYRAEEGR